MNFGVSNILTLSFFTMVVTMMAACSGSLENHTVIRVILFYLMISMGGVYCLERLNTEYIDKETILNNNSSYKMSLYGNKLTLYDKHFVIKGKLSEVEIKLNTDSYFGNSDKTNSKKSST